MEHLVKVVAKICPDSNIAKGMKCGRTKTTAIVRNILGQQSFTSLCEKLRTTHFSLLVDESTDRTTQKHLCLVVRYLDNNKVVDSFLGLIKLEEADSSTLYNHIKTFFENNKIPYKDNLIGFAADGANVMMGRHHSLMTYLQNDVPNLFIMKCICHSFHLCASYACQKLPRFVEDLTRDIYNYFNSSPKRTSEFTAYQSFCNVKVHKLLHPSQTRWLSVHFVVSRILEQYRPLQLYFTGAVANRDVLAAENILLKLNDPTSKLFLQFLDFVLPFFTNLNRNMQSESPKLHRIYRDVCNVLKTILDCFIKRDYLINTPLEQIDFKNPRNYMPLEEVYFGGSVNTTILEGRVTSEQLHIFRTRSLDFYIEACSQIIQRFPLKDNPLQLLNFLDPEVVKSGSIPSLSLVFSKFPNFLETTTLQPIDNEWRLLRNTEEVQSLSDDVFIFWQEVSNLKLGNEEQMFPSLTKFVFKIMCLPHSSATVERVFSAINLLKTKDRNKLDSETISALLLSKNLISGSNNNNCFDFSIDKQLINSMTNATLYEKKTLRFFVFFKVICSLFTCLFIFS